MREIEGSLTPPSLRARPGNVKPGETPQKVTPIGDLEYSMLAILGLSLIGYALVKRKNTFKNSIK